jgi:lipoprotein-releasing system permease protein
MNAGETTAVVVMALALSLLATLYPSWRAARLDPVEALRYE